MKQEQIKDDKNKVFISDKLLNFSPYEMMMSDSPQDISQATNQNDHYTNMYNPQSVLNIQTKPNSPPMPQITHQQQLLAQPNISDSQPINQYIPLQNQQVIQQTIPTNLNYNQQQIPQSYQQNPLNTPILNHPNILPQNNLIAQNGYANGNLIQNFQYFMTKEQRIEKSARIILKYRQKILTQKENEIFNQKESMNYILFFFLLATPFTSIRLIKKARLKPQFKNQYYFQLFLMNLIAFVGVSYTGHKVRDFAVECANKYVGHLSDQELMNFDNLFEQLEQQKAAQAMQQFNIQQQQIPYQHQIGSFNQQYIHPQQPLQYQNSPMNLNQQNLSNSPYLVDQDLGEQFKQQIQEQKDSKNI